MSTSGEERFKTYLFSYQHQGATWTLEIKAASTEDAIARVRKLHTATYDGELVEKIAIENLWWRSLASKVYRFLFTLK